MISAQAGPLIPGWVYEPYFPKADEDGLADLSAAWAAYATSLGETADDLHAAFEQMSSHTGPGADAASAKAQTVRSWLGTVASGADSLATNTEAAALLMTRTKQAINVVLASLQSTTAELLLEFAAVPLLNKAEALLKIRQLHIAAQAQCQALSAALVDELSQLDITVDVQPKPTVAGDGAGGASGGSSGASGPFEDTGLAPVSGDADEQARELVGANEHETTTAIGDGLTGATDVVDDPWSQAADNAFTEEERAALQEQAAEALVTGDTEVFDTESLTEAAATVTADEVDPTLIQPAQPSTPQEASTVGVDALTGQLTDEEILGGPQTTSPQPASPPTTSPEPAPVPTATLSPVTPEPSGTTAAGVPTTPERTWSPPPERPAPAPVPDRPAAATPAPQPVAHQPAPQPRPSAPVVEGGRPAPTPSASLWAPESGSAGSANLGASPSHGVPSAPGTSSASVSAPPAGSQPASAPVVGGAPMMGAPAPVAPPPAAAPMGPNLTSAPMSMPAGPMAPSGPLGGAPAGAPLSGVPSAAPAAPSQPAAPAQPAPAPAAQPVATKQPVATPVQVQAQPAQPGGQSSTPARGEGTAHPNDPNAPVAAAATALVGGGLLGSVWGDLRQSAPPVARPGSPLIAWPTQFGPNDDALAALPAGMGVAYQRVLLPGESDALLTGQLTTVRGLVHPLEQVRGLNTPAQLYDALGLGYSINEHTQPTAAFDRRADYVDVLRFAGVRDRDLIVPLDIDVAPDPAETIRALVRDHARPWTGSGSAPGATSTKPIEEFEILGLRALLVPHLAEVWRIHAHGPAQHLASWDARDAAWQGPAGGQRQATTVGRKADNGTFAVLADGTTFEAILLTNTHTVLIAHGAQAPGDFVPVQDGSLRKVISNDQIVRWLTIATIAAWQSPVGPVQVQVLRRSGDGVLIDYADHVRAVASAAGFTQLAQGHWASRWVPWAELTDVTEHTEEHPHLQLVR